MKRRAFFTIITTLLVAPLAALGRKTQPKPEYPYAEYGFPKAFTTYLQQPDGSITVTRKAFDGRILNIHRLPSMPRLKP